MNEVLKSILDLVNEMSPYLLLGFFIAGLMHVFIPRTWYACFLGGGSLRSVVNAALFGVPLPLCSCGVIPTAMSLRREGASKGAVVSFLIATPQTGVDSILATWSLMGLPFAIVRPLVAFCTAIFGGALVNVADREGAAPVSCATSEEGERPSSWGARLVAALRFAFVEMMEDIGKWLVVGLVVAAIITVCVPDEWFAVFKGNTVLSMLLVLCISIPMYLCATGSIPIAVALMLKGLTPGAALVLLMAGPACNAASILVINKVLGRKTLLLYLVAIVTGAVVFGMGVDYLLPREWFVSGLVAKSACCNETAGWFSWLCTGVLVASLLNVLRLRLFHKHACGHCHTHETSASTSLSLRHYRIEGMSCNHCKSNVARAVASVEGVTEVEVDLPGGMAVVRGTDWDDSAVVEAVESIGFAAKRMP